tara:strand:- start:577 stop:840 length:264 start_codon:yes stop_codon:yes gene_type:complete
MQQLARLAVLLLFSTLVVAIGFVIQSKMVVAKNRPIFWGLWGLSMVQFYSIWLFLESYYDLRLSPGKEGDRGVKGKRGVIGLKGRCL